MPNSVVHFEIQGAPGQGATLQQFYADACGWTITPGTPASYGLAFTGAQEPGGHGSEGAVEEAERPSVVIDVEVNDPAAYLQRVQAAGGTVVQDVTVIPGMVTMALFLDPAGKVVGLVGQEAPPIQA